MTAPDSQNRYYIEVSETTYKRFEKRRESTATHHTPEMASDTFVQSLLDTHAAVRSGFYDREVDDE